MSIGDKLLKSAAAGGLTPSENFNTVIYDGNGSANPITDVGFQPDLVWIKQRDVAVEQHNIYDSTRGIRNFIVSNSSAANVYGSANRLNAFDSGGFTLGSDNEINDSSSAYVAWCWKANGGTTSTNTEGSEDSTVQANDDAGFSIVKYEGTGSNLTVGHGLSAAPDVVILKNLAATTSWLVQHSSLGPTKALYLETTGAETDNATFWNDTAPTSTTVSIGTHSDGNTSGQDVIAYCFRSISGFSKFGSYEGNGAAYGPIVETGFEVGYVMIKNITSSGQDWRILDNKRNTNNPRNCYLSANNNSEEECQYDQLDFLSNGFQVIGTDGSLNENSSTMIYMAFATDPDTEQPTLADSFNAIAYSGNSSTNTITGYGFEPSLSVLKKRSGTDDWAWFDTIRGSNFVSSNTTSAEAAFTTWTPNADGFTVLSSGMVNATGSTYISYGWKANDDVPTIFGGPAVAVYKFEDDADDVTGNYDGTATSITYVTGKFNKAASFDGSNSYITASSFGISGNAARSYSAWVKTDGSTKGVICGIGAHGSAGESMFFAIDQVASDWDIWGYTASYDLEGNSLAAIGALSNGWHHFVLTWNASSTFKVYIDGALVDTQTKSATYSTTDTFAIGRWNADTNTTYYFNGEIDQVRIYSGVLEQYQVTELYNETTEENDDLTLGAPPMAIVSANANAGFSIVKYEGNGGNANVPHGLSAKPDFILIKNLDATKSWMAWHNSLSGELGYLDNNDAFASSRYAWALNSTQPTSTVVTVGGASNDDHTNGDGVNYIMYCFHSVTGYSKFGTYTGNGGTQAITGVGFQPDFVLCKSTSASSDWNVTDSARGVSQGLNPNTSAAEGNQSPNGVTVFGTDGFTVVDNSGGGASVNGSSITYIYAAFKIN